MDTLDPSGLYRAALFVVLGAVGTLLLLPLRSGRDRVGVAALAGYALVAAALACFASLWSPVGPLLTRLFFYVFAVHSVLGSILTVTNKNPVHSALWFASVVLATSGLFLIAGAQFLAAGTVIVYAGAIIVTFLFVIMLARMEGRADYDRMARSPGWATFSGFFLLFGLIYSALAIKPSPPPEPGRYDYIIVQHGARPVPVVDRMKFPARLTPAQKLILGRAVPATSMLPGAMGTEADMTAAGPHVAGLGSALYTDHLVVVELTGALLFAALIGALAIASPKAPVRPLTRTAAAEAGR